MQCNFCAGKGNVSCIFFRVTLHTYFLFPCTMRSSDRMNVLMCPQSTCYVCTNAYKVKQIKIFSTFQKNSEEQTNFLTISNWCLLFILFVKNVVTSRHKTITPISRSTCASRTQTLIEKTPRLKLKSTFRESFFQKTLICLFFYSEGNKTIVVISNYQVLHQTINMTWAEVQ